MWTGREKRLRIGMVIPCHVGGSVHEHRDHNELWACEDRHKEHVTIETLTFQILNAEGRNKKSCFTEEARASAERARENAEKARAAAEREVAKAEHAKTEVEEAKAKVEEAKAKVEEAKAEVEVAKAKAEEERNKRIFGLLQFRDIIGMNNIQMILGIETGSSATMSDPQFRMNTSADRVPAATSSDELV